MKRRSCCYLFLLQVVFCYIINNSTIDFVLIGKHDTPIIYPKHNFSFVSLKKRFVFAHFIMQRYSKKTKLRTKKKKKSKYSLFQQNNIAPAGGRVWGYFRSKLKINHDLFGSLLTYSYLCSVRTNVLTIRAESREGRTISPPPNLKPLSGGFIYYMQT